MNSRGWNGATEARRDVQHSPLLGKIADKKLGALLGCSATTVRYWRLKGGIPPAEDRSHPRLDVGASPLLGTMSDVVLAKQLGCDRDTVRRWRWRLGIAVYQPKYQSLPSVTSRVHTSSLAPVQK